MWPVAPEVGNVVRHKNGVLAFTTENNVSGFFNVCSQQIKMIVKIVMVIPLSWPFTAVF